MVLGCKGGRKKTTDINGLSSVGRLVVQGPHLFESGTGTCFED